MASEALARYHLTLADVRAMVDAGTLPEDTRVELDDGLLVEMNPIGPEHQSALQPLTEHFVPLAPRYRTIIQGMMAVPGGFVLPDLMVVEALSAEEDVRTALLVVEVAQTSHRRDAEKAATYAAAGVPEYWIVDVPARGIQVHREPDGPRYRQALRFVSSGELQPLIEAPPVHIAALFNP